jgi:hypothetical protein
VSRPAGAVGKRTRKFEKLVRKLEREKKISVEYALRRLFQRATDTDPKNAATANAACRQFLDRVLGPTIARLQLDVEFAEDPLVKMLREIARDRAVQAKLAEGEAAIETTALLPAMDEPPEES